MMSKHKVPGLKALDKTSRETLSSLLLGAETEGHKWLFGGSRVVEGLDWDDVDVVMLGGSNFGSICEQLESRGYVEGGSDIPESSEFRSYKKGKVNIILCKTEDFYNKWVEATNIVAKYQIKDKYKRIYVHGFLRKDPEYSSSRLFASILSGKPAPVEVKTPW